MGIELGLWDGFYRDVKVSWLRAWDASTGNILPTLEEQIEAAKTKRKRAEQFTAKRHALDIDPDA